MTENLNPETQEQKPSPVYLEQANDILEYATDKQGEVDREVLDAQFAKLFDTIYESAENGDLVSQRGDIYTPDIITDHLSAFKHELGQPDDKRSSNFRVLIPSQGGMRKAFLELSSNQATKLAFKEALDLKLWLLDNQHEGSAAIESSVDISAESEEKDLREPEKLKEIGHEGTEAAGIDEPSSELNNELGAVEVIPTREEPYIYNDGIQRPYSFSSSQITGTGDAVGYYYEKNKVILLIDPSPETRRLYSFSGNYIKVDGDNASGMNVQQESSDELLVSDAARRIVEVSEQPPTQEQVGMSADEYLSKLTEGFSDADVHALQDYSVCLGAEQRTRSIGEFDNAAHWAKEKAKALSAMSSEARAIAEQYVHADTHYR